MNTRPESSSNIPGAVDMERFGPWQWRVTVLNDRWTTEHLFYGPKWLAKRHIRRIYHRIRRASAKRRAPHLDQDSDGDR